MVSPDDIYLSAGGGAALALLEKAGKTAVLIGQISHRGVIVTSGFRLPVNHILHAATVALKPDGSSETTDEDVRITMLTVLQTAHGLGVQILFVPLLGAGTEALPADKSLCAILKAFLEATELMTDFSLRLVVVVRHESELPRNEARAVIQANLPAFTLGQPAT